MESFDVIVIGSGPAGYIAAIRASQLGLKTACIDERKNPGGTCLNVGCIPSKTLLHASELYSKIKVKGSAFGLDSSEISYSWDQMQARKQKVIQDLHLGIFGLFKKNKVTWIQGKACFADANTLLVGDQKITAKFIIIATGSEPTALPFLPFDEEKVISSTGALSLKKIPEQLLVIGAGVIGVELGSVFQRLGSKVTFIEFMDRICPAFDEGLTQSLQTCLTKQGMTFLLSTKVEGATCADKVRLNLSSKETIEGDIVLVAVGRKPLTRGLNLEKIGIAQNPQGFIEIDGNFRTTVPHILAIGDVVEGPMLAHKASEEGVAAAEICAGLTPQIHYISIPNVIYTSPEVASVGFTEEELKKRKIAFTSGKSTFKGNSRARCMGEDDGFVKVLADTKTDRILGVHVIGPYASELIGQGAMALGKSALDLGSSCYAHPTLSESLKEAFLAIHKKALHQ